MKSYQVHIPEKPDELPGLVGKVVRYLELYEVPRDFYLFLCDETSIELICQETKLLSLPPKPDNKVASIRVLLKNLNFTCYGLKPQLHPTRFRKEEKKTYSPTDKEYEPRQKALEPSELWVKPETV